MAKKVSLQKCPNQWQFVVIKKVSQFPNTTMKLIWNISLIVDDVKLLVIGTPKTIFEIDELKKILNTTEVWLHTDESGQKQGVSG